MTEASDTLRRARRPGRADRTSARARHETGCRIRAVRKADVSNEGTARSAAWRLPEAGIVKGLASPLTRTPAAQLLKLPRRLAGGTCTEPAVRAANAMQTTGGRNPHRAVRAANTNPPAYHANQAGGTRTEPFAQRTPLTADKPPSRRRSTGSRACPDTSSPRHYHSPTQPASAAACPPAPTYSRSAR